MLSFSFSKLPAVDSLSPFILLALTLSFLETDSNPAAAAASDE